MWLVMIYEATVGSYQNNDNIPDESSMIHCRVLKGLISRHDFIIYTKDLAELNHAHD